MATKEELLKKIPLNDGGKPMTRRLEEIQHSLLAYKLEPMELQLLGNEIDASIERLKKRNEAFLRKELRKHAAQKAD